MAGNGANGGTGSGNYVSEMQRKLDGFTASLCKGPQRNAPCACKHYVYKYYKE